MGKQARKIGVGCLQLQIAFPEGEDSDAAGATEGNGSQASSASPAVGSRAERKRKWYSLIDKVYAFPNLWSAWQRVRANGGAAGADGMSVRKFAESAVARLEALSADLGAKSYRPQPVRRKLIPKSGGGTRPLGIPTVRDRIVQQALLQVLEPIFEAKFSNRSHGFRKDRGCATALDVVDRAVRYGYTHVVDADIRSFFDTVDHAKLLVAVNEEIADGSVLRLIGQILTAGVVMPGSGDVEPTEVGTPQGGPLSPLLANIYLHRLDVRLTEAGYGLVRYADDFVVFARSEDEAAAALDLAREVLEGELELKLHPEKTRVVSVAVGFEFLGFHYFRDPKTQRMAKEVRPKSVHRFREAVRLRTPRLHAQRAFKREHVVLGRLAKNERIRTIIDDLNLYLRGWHWYFKSAWCLYGPPFGSFDSLVRRRVRLAITGRVGSGWWNQLITNRMLARLGLVSIVELQSEYLSGRLSASARKG
jgi:RNA-directed DNA polymerase